MTVANWIPVDGSLQRRLWAALMTALAGLMLFSMMCPAYAKSYKAKLDGNMVALDRLHPTQAAVGMREVARKQALAAGHRSKDGSLDKYVAKHPIPVVIGPGGKYYMIDHHHLGLALSRLGVQQAPVRVVEDLSSLSPGQFWTRMQSSGRLRPVDENGQSIAPSQLPSSLKTMRNDPYRDLAASVRDAGGFAKSKAPYSEFSWADFFRKRIPAKLLESNPEGALAQALKLAHGREAASLPGYSGS